MNRSLSLYIVSAFLQSAKINVFDSGTKGNQYTKASPEQMERFQFPVNLYCVIFLIDEAITRTGRSVIKAPVVDRSLFLKQAVVEFIVFMLPLLVPDKYCFRNTTTLAMR